MTSKHPATSLEKPALHIVLVAALLILMLAVVGTMTTVTGTISAHGVIITTPSARMVMASIGGIIASRAVQEGSTVAQGDLLIGLETGDLDRALARIARQRNSLRLREARLRSLSDGATELTLSPELERSLADQSQEALIATERDLFEADRSALLAERSRLRAEHHRARDRVRALESEIQSKEQEVDILTREIEAARKPGTAPGDDQLKIRDLRPPNPVAEQRLLALERDRARLMGELHRLKSARSETAAERADIDRRLATLTSETRRRALIELAETSAKLRALDDEAHALEGQHSAHEIRAPLAGTVRNLAVSAPGTRIEPGTIVMTIAATDDHLAVEAEIAPRDVGFVAIGHRAWARLPRGPPDLEAVVEDVSAEKPRNPEARVSRFIARLRLAPEAMPSPLLVPGLPVDVVIETGAQSTLAYVLRPLIDALTHPMPR